ncbi:MAG: hypothetical protein OXC31_23440 [Spirochaetaceae bacterium]|nr:hypothetical protein [Spirochaetaceae bacterium]
MRVPIVDGFQHGREAARRGGVSLMTAARAALDRGLASEEAERRQPRGLAAPAAMAVEPVERNRR